MKIYVQSYLIGCSFGIANEVFFKYMSERMEEVTAFCLDNKLKTFINAFIVNVYGWGFVLTALMEPVLKRLNAISQLLLLGLLVAVIESFVYSVFLNVWDGYSPMNHNYNDSNFYPLLEGKTSLVSIIYFSIVLYIYLNYFICTYFCAALYMYV